VLRLLLVFLVNFILLVRLHLVMRDGHILDFDFGEFPSCYLVGEENVKLAEREAIRCQLQVNTKSARLTLQSRAF